MLKKNLDSIKKDITKNNFYEKYLKEFPELEQELNKLKKKPGCGVCINGFFTPLFEKKDLTKKLETIYGTPVEVDINISKEAKVTWTPDVIVEEVPAAEYPTYAKEKLDIKSKLQVRMYSTCYNPKNDTIIVTMSVLRRNN